MFVELRKKTTIILRKPAMEMLPKALEKALGALLCDHSVSSWKIAAEGPNPTIVLRLRPSGQSQENGYCIQRKTFRAKPPSQVERDRRRWVEYNQRFDSKKDQSKQLSDTANASEICPTENVTINDTTSVRNLNRDSGSVDLESDKTDSESVNSTATILRSIFTTKELFCQLYVPVKNC